MRFSANIDFITRCISEAYMKSLVAYFTQTNNTRMIAEAIFEALSAHDETSIESVRRVNLESLDESDLLFVGGPCHDSDLAPPVRGFLEKLTDSPKFRLAGFFTHATYMPDGDRRNDELYTRWAGRCHLTFEDTCRRKNIEFLGYFHCQGKASSEIEDFIRREIIIDDDEWNEYLPRLRKHPDSGDVKNAKKFVQDILNKL
jgi:flavodoxin